MTAIRLLAVALVPGTTAVLTLPRKSQALPWLSAPAYLQELPGNADFDPLRLGSASPALLKYYREAELKHGRLAMLAAVGWPASELWDQKLADTFGVGTALTSKLEAPSVLNGGLDRISPAFWGAALCGNQPVRRVHFTKSFLGDDVPALVPSSGEEPASPPLSRRRVDGVEDDAMIQHGRAVKF